MSPSAIGAYITVIVATLVIGLDLVLAFNKHKGDTYSEVIRAWGRSRLWVVILMCFALGMLAGHWFWVPACE